MIGIVNNNAAAHAKAQQSRVLKISSRIIEIARRSVCCCRFSSGLRARRQERRGNKAAEKVFVVCYFISRYGRRSRKIGHRSWKRQKVAAGTDSIANVIQRRQALSGHTDLVDTLAVEAIASGTHRRSDTHDNQESAKQKHSESALILKKAEHVPSIPFHPFYCYRREIY
jgi:hypothetical protein